MKYGEIKTLLTTDRFLPLFICQFLGAFGDNLIRTALVTLLTFTSSQFSDVFRSILVTFAMGLFMAPFIAFSATAGQLADKYNKASLIKWIRCIGIFVTIIGVVGFYTNNYPLILLCIFLTGTESAFFGPVKYSILPDHLDKRELLVGNGLIEAGTFLAILFGLIIGGVLGTQSYSILAISITLLGISILCFISSLFIPKTTPASDNIIITPNILKEAVECMKYAAKDEKTFLVIMGISWFWMIGGVILSQLPGYTKEALNGDHSVYTLLLGVFSIGTGIGSIVCNRILKGQINTQYVPISILLMTVFIFWFWLTGTQFIERNHLGGIHYFLAKPEGLLVCFEILMIAICGGVFIVPLYAYLQIRAKKSHRSRIIAANNIYNAIFMVIATIFTMFLIYIGASISSIILLAGVVNLFTAAYICRILPHTVIKNIFQALFKILYRVEVRGLENFEKAGDKVLIISNHASFIDPPLLGAFLPARLVFAIDTFHARSWWIRPFLSYLRAFPIDPTNPMATKALIEQLKLKHPVVIFPEGRITVTGSLMKIYEGPGLIADKANAKLLPVRIDGPQYSLFSRLHGKVKLQLFPKITITILEPQKIDAPANLVGRDRRHFIGKKLYDIMSNMMFEGHANYGTLFESLLEAKRQYGSNKTIVEDVDRNKLNYNRIITGSFILGKKIFEQTKNSKHVGIFLPNAAGTAVTFFACLAYNKVPAMLNYSTGIRNTLLSCSAAKISTVYTSYRFIEKANFQSYITAFEQSGIKVVYLEDVRKSLNIIDKLFAYVAAKFPTTSYKLINDNKTPNADEPAVILFTSGTEGTPKGVVLSHTNIQSNIRQLASRVDFNSSDKIFNSLPIFHSFGLTGGFLTPILSGISAFFYPSPLHYRIIPEMVYGSNATIMFGTDTFLSGYAKYAHPYDFYSVRYIFSGAEKLKQETKKVFMEKFGIRIFEGYGTTETSPAISVNTPMHYKTGSVGRILPNIDWIIEPVKGISKGGKLIVSGPNLMLGYLKTDNPGVIQPPSYKINGKSQKGWYDTGDVVEIDEDEFITIQGRVKRFAKIGGEMVSLAVTEEIIHTLWPDNIHAVISVPHPKRGETLVLFTNHAKIDREKILHHIKSMGFTELFQPKIIQVMKNIPVLGSGKIDYMELKKLADSINFDQIPSEED